MASSSDEFDAVCLATALHRMASIAGGPHMHAHAVQAPEFHKLKRLIRE